MSLVAMNSARDPIPPGTEPPPVPDDTQDELCTRSWQATDSEFERLMQDSVDSKNRASQAAHVVPPGAQHLLDSPSPPVQGSLSPWTPYMFDTPQPPPQPTKMPHSLTSPQPLLQGSLSSRTTQMPDTPQPHPQPFKSVRVPFSLDSPQPPLQGSLPSRTLCLPDSSPAHLQGSSASRDLLHSPLQRPLIPGETAQANSSVQLGPSLDCEDHWEVARLSGRLEEISRDLRKSVEAEFMLAEKSVAARYKAALGVQQHQASVVVAQQQSFVQMMQSDKQQLTRRLELKQKQWERSLGVVQRVRRRFVGKCVLQTAFYCWRVGCIEEKHGLIMCRLTGKIWQKNLATLIFGTWRRQTNRAWKERLVTHERAVGDAVRSKLLEQMELQRGCLTSEVEHLKRQLAEEKRQRELLQDNLKRVFMRGVCALNFEAMSLLSEGAMTEQSPDPPLPPDPPSLPVASLLPVASFEGTDAEVPIGYGSRAPLPLPFVTYTGPLETVQA